MYIYNQISGGFVSNFFKKAVQRKKTSKQRN